MAILVVVALDLAACCPVLCVVQPAFEALAARNDFRKAAFQHLGKLHIVDFVLLAILFEASLKLAASASNAG